MKLAFSLERAKSIFFFVWHGICPHFILEFFLLFPFRVLRLKAWKSPIHSSNFSLSPFWALQSSWLLSSFSLDANGKTLFPLPMNYQLTRVSKNAKTGPIPVSTSSKLTCPDACPLKKSGCYATTGKVNIHWLAVTRGERGLPWAGFVQAIKDLPRGQLWRHNQAGDLPGENNAVDATALRELVAANKGRNGFTYTHKPTLEGQADATTVATNRKAIAHANANGFTVNLSADTLGEADALASLAIGPVATLLPSTQTRNTYTPQGRKVVVCPATQRENVTCSSCKLCQRVGRSVIVGFPAHGLAFRKVDAIASA